MHFWGEKNVDWGGIENSAYEIGDYLTRWGRISVSCRKEKFGTARVYCDFGINMIHSIFFPYHIRVHTWWPTRLDHWIIEHLPYVLFRGIDLWQNYIYRKAYLKAVRKRPHLYKEIVCGADYGELFEGYLPGYKHSDYWTEIK